MAPCRFLLQQPRRHQLAYPYLFLISCAFGYAASPATCNPQQQQQIYSASTPQNSPTSQVSTGKPRVNVSKVCEQTGIHVTVRTSRPFFGLIHAKDKRRKSACATEGAGQQLFTMDFEYMEPEEEGYCGLVVQRVPLQQQTSKESSPSTSTDRRIMSLILVVRLHKTIESSEDQFFLLSCASYHNQPHKSNCSYNRATNESNPGEEQLHEAYYKLNTRNDPTPNRWEDSLLSQTPKLELRYQWLVHVSCTLAALLAITLCVALWLCGIRYSRIQKSGTSKELTSKQILYTSNQSSNKNTLSIDEHSSSSDEPSIQTSARTSQVNGRHQGASLHSPERITRPILCHKVDHRDAQGQVLINTFDPEQAVNYFNTYQRSIANPYQNFTDLLHEPTLEHGRGGPVLEAITMKQDFTANNLVSNGQMYRLQTKSNPIISQFDPQDSRQLLDLIQQKQLQQIPQQANISVNQI